MPLQPPSRRHFLAGLLAALTAWLRPRRTAARTKPPKPVLLPPGPTDRITTLVYDGQDRLLMACDEVPRHSLPPSHYDRLDRGFPYLSGG
jgi:hypothetical protein